MDATGENDAGVEGVGAGGGGADVTLRAADVDLRGLLAVLGENLYSNPVVAIRELVQNGHDSILRRRLEDPAWSGGAVRIRGEAPNTLIIEDDGAGLTSAEIHDFLATIGRGYTSELRGRVDDDGLIGQFGLGFLTAFVIADEVQLETLSYQTPGRPWIYASSNGERYTVVSGSRETAGTRVALKLSPGYERLADNNELRGIALRYCKLLAVPVYVDAEKTPVNAEPPPWRSDLTGVHPVLRRRQALDFARTFERRFEPLVTIAVSGESGADVNGILWINGGASYVSSDQRRLAVFVRGMLIDDNARDLLPGWAGFVSGVLESSALTPTASREDLKRDPTWEAVARHLHERVITGLAETASDQPEAWRRVVLRHNEALLGASLSDPRLLDLLAEQVQIPTSQGDLTMAEILRASAGKLHLAREQDQGVTGMLFGALRIPIARSDRYAVAPFVRRYAARHGLRIVELGTEHGDAELFKAGAVTAAERDWLAETLADPHETLVVSRFAPEELPLVVVVDREAEIKARIESDEADGRIAAAALRLARSHTETLEGGNAARVHVNLNSSGVMALLDARRVNSAGALRAASLLRAVKRLTAGVSDTRAPDGVVGALRDINAAVTELCRTEADR